MSSTPTHDGLNERSFGELAKLLSQEASDLARKEVELAKAETAAKAKLLGKGAGFLAAGGIVGLVVVGTLAAAAVLALATALPSWLAALIVAGVAALLAAVLAMIGIKLLQRATPPAPTQTVESVKEDVEWVKTRAKSGMK